MKAYQHILFWILVHGALTLIFGKWFEGYIEAFYYVSLLLPVVIATSYFFNYFLVPRYLFTRNFIRFGVYTFYMFVISLTLELLASVTSMLLMIQFGINESGPLVTDVFMLAIILHFIVLFKSFILLIKHYYVDQTAIQQLEEEKSKSEKGFIMVRSRRKNTRIEYSNLRYIESLADYTKIHLVDGGEVVSKAKIGQLEEELPEHFLRIHRSFIVNREKITSFSREEMLLGDISLPVSRSYRKTVISSLSR
ncbi:MAG: LytTR family DNA-binding domain-containing protein [Bacteroidales bacterium]